MAKTIAFNYKNKAYKLEFTRDTVMRMETAGFDISGFSQGQRPFSSITALFRGAFMANHADTAPDVIDKIWAKLPRKDEVITKLVEMYSEPFETLMAEPDDKGELDWKAN